MSHANSNPTSLLANPVLRKISTGVTGLLLVLYLGQHLFANLQIFSSDHQAVSKYGYSLESFGPLLRIIEIALGALIAFHAIMGIVIWLKKRKARPINYKLYRSKGTPSKQNLASRTMLVGGLVLLIFLVVHVAYFRFGPGIEEGYATIINEEPARHYERLVKERFQNIGYVIFYTFSMIAVGFHISHGFWSAFQSLGISDDRIKNSLHRLSVFLGVAFAIGFLAIVWGTYWS